MAIFLLLLLAFIIFIIYRYQKYQKQRKIEDMAADAQAYVSAEVVDILQRYKTLLAQHAMLDEDAQKLQQQLKNLTENLLCHTDSESSVREYLALAKQSIAVINLKLNAYAEINSHQADNDFEMLK